MPRPLVEVRQAVLNPVVTINDPQQEVCLIGLHTADFVDEEVHSLDRPGSVSLGDDVHIGSPAALTFEVETEGVFIDAAVDFGPDSYDISGDHTLNVSEAFVTAHDIVGGAYNSDDDVSAAGAIDRSELTFANIATLATTLSDAGQGNSIVVMQPDATYANKLVYYSGDTVDFNTEPTYFSGLGVGSLVYFGTKDFRVIRKDSDAIFLVGVTEADHAELVPTVGISLQTAANQDIASIAGTQFKLINPGIHESVVNTATVGTNLSLQTPPPFVIREADKAVLQATLITKVADSSLASLAISEADSEAADRLAISVAADGDASLTIPVTKMSFDAKPIVRAKYTLTYTVAKNNLSTGLSQVDSNTRESVLGISSPRNPLSLAAEVALANAPTSRISVLSLDISPPEGSTDVRSLETAYSDALNILNRQSTVYAMVPLTVNNTVTKSYANAAEAMSVPSKGKFRICLGSSAGAPTLDFIIGSANSPAKLGINTESNGVHTITNNAGDYYLLPTSKVLADDSVVATSASAVYTGIVESATNTALTITWDDGAAPAAGATELTGYYVARSLAATSKIPRQIEILQAEAAALASKRLFLTFPGTCTVVSGNDSYVGMPSYYVTSAFAGLLARLEIHRPKNFIGLNSILGLEGFSRFSDEQLDQISDSGYLVFQQEEATSAPFCIHQVNTEHGTSAGTQEFTELSVLANFDFVSRYLKEVLDPFAGTMNIVPSTLGLIRSSLDAAMENLIARRTALIGAPLLSGEIDFIRQASYDQGTVEASVLVSLPKVLNKIIIEVVSG